MDYRWTQFASFSSRNTRVNKITLFSFAILIHTFKKKFK